MQVKGNTKESTNHDKSRIIKKIIGEQEQACKDFKKQLRSHTNRALKKTRKNKPDNYNKSFHLLLGKSLCNFGFSGILYIQKCPTGL